MAGSSSRPCLSASTIPRASRRNSFERSFFSAATKIACVADAMTEQSLRANIGRPEQYVTVYSGMETQPFKLFQLRTNYQYQRGVHLLHGRNLNAPVPGFGRPDPAVGNITNVESSAYSSG